MVRERSRDAEKAALVKSIVADLEAHAKLTGPRRLASIFFGGGTPSLMAAGSIASIIDTARRLWTPSADLEISLEANPTDAESAGFADIASAGVQRLSLGVQSLNDRDLAFLGRNHDAGAARKAVALANAAFPRLSVDLIYALPGQSAEDWRERLTAAVDLGCEHISAYQLSIEPGAAFDRAVRRNVFQPAPPDRAADLYEITQNTLLRAGYVSYEVSNHARDVAAKSRHNLIYWRGGDYVGVGPGAHGRLTLDGARWATTAPRRIADYIARVNGIEVGAALERMSCHDTALERLLMGLRTDEGVPMRDLRVLGISSAKFEAMHAFVALHDDRLYATQAGRLVLDRVIGELVLGHARD